ncbi:spliceosomal snRNP assembly [Desmophyllum pertusum]|uniref:Spliceosomal snRNP assembly n=1 Tax=Desmophyllum pertusum TaxID=174260 RepID=A0A9W9Z0D2_9CNID|nr:spliceosomal snRNP assembly [Desmophyllum pertusum]
MADPRDQQYHQEHQYGTQHHWTRDDFSACASANANYCYQMSLWWWNTYMQNVQTRTHSWASQFEDQSCECAERSMVVEDDCYCCQNDGGFETQRHQMDVCKDCPDSQLCTGPPWQRSQGECSNSTGNHRDLIVKENESSDKNADDDDWPGGDEDERSDSDNDDDYSDNDDDDDENSDDNMEVDDNFRKFLQQSERHRHEREQRKQEILKEKDDYIEVGSLHLNTTTSAPSEQPGAKRKAEMKTLYGKHASVIMSLEASLQLNYDKHCDLRQPIFWPSIPLKF